MMSWLDWPWMDIGLYTASVCFLITGLLGTVVPVLPGLPIMVAGALLAALPNDFEIVGAWTLVVFTILALVGVVLDMVGQSLGAKRVQASPWAIWGSVIGALVGFVVMNLVGMLVFPFIGAVVGELYATRNVKQAGRVGWATWMGMLITAALKVAIALVMVVWLVALFVMHA